VIGSLCTGIRGLDLAVQAMWGGEVAWHAEIDPSCSAWLERNSPGVPNLGDIKKVEWSTVPRVDVLTAGFPCQPFSHAGRRKGEDDERHLWPAVAEAIRVLRPGRVVLENVPGLRSLGLGRVLADLASMGYVGRWGSVRASDAGAPHQRDRIFVVATDSRCGDAERHGEPGDVARPSGEAQGEGDQRERCGDAAGDRGAVAPDSSRLGRGARTGLRQGDATGGGGGTTL
jgi:DNA (cytosine-5)-methyltransferase 1